MNLIKNLAKIIASFLSLIVIGSFLNWVLCIAFNCQFWEVQQSPIWILYFIVSVISLAMHFVDENS
jgi:hypothetical protein